MTFVTFHFMLHHMLSHCHGNTGFHTLDSIEEMDPNAEGILYCPEQIKIPGELPDILKDFTKAAIRTQPPDLLKWSAA